MKCYRVLFTMETSDFFKEKAFFVMAEDEFAAGTCAIAGEAHKPAQYTDEDKQTIVDQFDITYAVQDVKEVNEHDVETIKRYVDVYEYEQEWIDSIQAFA